MSLKILLIAVNFESKAIPWFPFNARWLWITQQEHSGMHILTVLLNGLLNFVMPTTLSMIEAQASAVDYLCCSIYITSTDSAQYAQGMSLWKFSFDCSPFFNYSVQECLKGRDGANSCSGSINRIFFVTWLIGTEGAGLFSKKITTFSPMHAWIAEEYS